VQSDVTLVRNTDQAVVVVGVFEQLMFAPETVVFDTKSQTTHPPAFKWGAVSCTA